MGKIVEGLPHLLGGIDTGKIFADRLLGAILGLSAINLLISFLPSPKAAPEVFAIRNWIRARSGNSTLQTRQSLASQVTSQIVGPEINVTFRYNSKKVRRAWSISQIIIDLILG
jgi:hypothetical protein